MIKEANIQYDEDFENITEDQGIEQISQITKPVKRESMVRSNSYLRALLDYSWFEEPPVQTGRIQCSEE